MAVTQRVINANGRKIKAQFPRVKLVFVTMNVWSSGIQSDRYSDSRIVSPSSGPRQWPSSA